MSTVIAGGYCLSLGLTGYAIGVALLRVRSGLALAGCTAVLGTAAFLVVCNALGYIVPIQQAFWVTLLLLLGLAGALLLWQWKREGTLLPSCELPPWWLWGIFLAAIVVAGTMGARHPGSDPHAWTHYPLASTIMEGNFPVVEVVNPWSRLGYHYGPAFLAAAFSKITGFPLVAGYGFQPLLGLAGALLFAAALAHSLTHSWRAVALCSLLALFGGGLVWLKGIWLLTDLYQHVVTGPPLAAPFRNLVPAMTSTLVNPIVQASSWRTFATGMPLFFGLLFCLHGAFGERTWQRLVCWGSVALLLAVALALTMEGSFALFYPAVLLFIAIHLLLRLLQQPWEGEESVSWSRIAAFSGILFLSALFLARIQGGTLTATGSDVNANAFSWYLDGYTEYHTWGLRVAFWHWMFLRDFGLPLLLLPWITVYVWRRRTRSPFLLFLLILALGHLTAPFAVHYSTLPGELKRLFYVANSVFCFLTGIALEHAFLSRTQLWRRITGYTLVGMMLVTGTLYTSVRLFFPSFRLESVPLFAHMPPITQEQRALYAWVRDNSTIQDYFYLFSTDDTREEALFTTKSEAEVQQMDRIHFMTYTGRFTIGPIISWYSLTDERWFVIRRMEETCALEAARELSIRYLVVENAERAEWFAAHCSVDSWVLRYDAGDEEHRYPRVYERAP